MAIPEYPTLPSQVRRPREARSRIGRVLVHAAYFAAMLVLCFAGVILLPGAVVLTVLTLSGETWPLALGALVAVVAWILAVRFIGNRMVALGTERRSSPAWDEHF